MIAFPDSNIAIASHALANESSNFVGYLKAMQNEALFGLTALLDSGQWVHITCILQKHHYSLSDNYERARSDFLLIYTKNISTGCFTIYKYYFLKIR